MSFITSIGTANPIHKLRQSDIAEFMVRAMDLNADDTRKLRAIFKSSGIKTRYSVIADYGKTHNFSFFENKAKMESFPTTKSRMDMFRRYALPLSIEATTKCLNQIDNFRKDSITHLILVSCTGMYAPGLDIDLVKALGLNSNIKRTQVNFMGCYAAFTAMKLGHEACISNSKAKVLILCTELCTIHFQKEATEDNFLANALFGDGSAALLMESTTTSSKSLEPKNFHCDLATEGEHDMTWSIGDFGFEMRLSSYVPKVIQNGIRDFTAKLLSNINLSKEEISFFAIHSGGRRILQVIEKELEISTDQNRPAYNVLENFGNMSSPTVLFALNEIFLNLSPADHGNKILSIAFGPGLTMESMVLNINFNK